MVSDRTKAVAPDPRLARILAAQAVFLVGGGFSPQRPRNRPHLQRSQLPIGRRHFKEFWIFGQRSGALGLVPEPVKRGKGIVELDELALGVGYEHGVGHAGQCHIQFFVAHPQRLLLFISRNRQQAAPVAFGQQADQYAHRGKQNQGNGIRGLSDGKTSEWWQNQVVHCQYRQSCSQ